MVHLLIIQEQEIVGITNSTTNIINKNTKKQGPNVHPCGTGDFTV
jgi:hypothetical protein